MLRCAADDIDPVGADAAQFRMDDDRVPVSLDGLADQGLVVSAAVVGGGIEKIDAEVEGAVDRRDTIVIVLLPIISRHAHAAEADGRDHEIRRPKLDVSHETALSFRNNKTAGPSPGPPFTEFRSGYFLQSTLFDSAPGRG